MVGFLYNHKVLKERRRSLRNHQTAPEKWLWRSLSKSQLKGFKFTRQYSAGPYIIDFYCPKLRLAVEIDGDSHRQNNSQIYDQERTDYLASLDIKVIRFTNQDVLNHLHRVLEKIKLTTERAPS